jgi:hypothetical protein
MRYRLLLVSTVRVCGCWDWEVGNEGDENEGDGNEGFDVCYVGTDCLLFGE